jgi:hypothetical protein
MNGLANPVKTGKDLHIQEQGSKALLHLTTCQTPNMLFGFLNIQDQSLILSRYQTLE